jgi:hypothetical protein
LKLEEVLSGKSERAFSLKSTLTNGKKECFWAQLSKDGSILMIVLIFFFSQNIIRYRLRFAEIRFLGLK